MDRSIYSPVELWHDFTLEGRLLKKNIIESKKENGFVFEKFFVDGIDSSRIFCKQIFPDNNKKNKKTVLFLNDGGRLFSDAELLEISQGNFAVATVDYAGENPFNDDFHSIYPEELSYGNISVCRNDLNSGKNIQESPWFLWARNIRIAISAILETPYIFSGGLMIGGIGRGSLLAMQVAAADKRCLSVICVSGYGYLTGAGDITTEQSLALTEENEMWLSAFSMSANAKLISVPTLLTANTNNPFVNVDNIGMLKSTFATENVYVCITPSFSFSVSDTAFSAIKAFISDVCLNKNKLPVIAEPTAEVKNDKIVFEFSSATQFKNCYLWYSHAQEQNKYRCWYGEKMRSKDGKLFTAEVNLRDVSDEIRYFVSCSTGAFCLTSVLSQKDIPHKAFIPGERRIIFNGSMDKNLFFAENETFESDCHLKKEEGPFKIGGITGSGVISSYILSDIKLKPKDVNILSLDVYGVEAKSFTIALYKEANGCLIRYFSSWDYTPQPKWDKMTLDPSSFKNDKNIDMKDWNNIKKISFENVDGMLFNNILWI